MGYTFHDHGHPSVDAATCIGCGQCASICPDAVLTMRDGRPIPGDGGFMGCIACGHCTAICPTRSITVTGRNMQAEDLLELPPPSGRATAEQLENLLLWRRSIRQFTDREIDRPTLDRVLAMTTTAPMGIPPSEVGIVVFHGRQKVQAMAEDACRLFERQAKMFSPWRLMLMRPFLGRAGYEAMRDFVRPLLATLVQMRREGKDHFTYNAPAALLFYHGSGGDSADVHIAATYATLAAESLGLGSCMLGTSAAFNFDKPFQKKYGIPVGSKVGLMVILGYPAVKFRRGVRRRLAAVEFV